MLGGKYAATWCYVTLVVSDGTAAQDKTSDVQVEWFVLRGVFGCQRVEHKLKIGFALCCLFIEIGTQTENLCRGYRDAPLRYRHIVELGRQTAGIDQTVSLLIVHHYIVDNDTIEET